MLQGTLAGAGAGAIWSDRGVLRVLGVRDLDAAIDAAARRAAAVVGEYVATARPGRGEGVEIAVEFLVPPDCLRSFGERIDEALMARSPGYAAGRLDRRFDPLRITAAPAGTFHQWRVAWSLHPTSHDRWTADRAALEGVLRQARTGWREV